MFEYKEICLMLGFLLVTAPVLSVGVTVPALAYGIVQGIMYATGKGYGIYKDQLALEAVIVSLTGEKEALVRQTLIDGKLITDLTGKIDGLSRFCTPQLFYGVGITLAVVVVAGGGWYLYRQYNSSEETLKKEKKIKTLKVKDALRKCLFHNENAEKDSEGMPVNCKEAMQTYLDAVGGVKLSKMKTEFLRR